MQWMLQKGLYLFPFKLNHTKLVAMTSDFLARIRAAIAKTFVCLFLCLCIPAWLGAQWNKLNEFTADPLYTVELDAYGRVIIGGTDSIYIGTNNVFSAIYIADTLAIGYDLIAVYDIYFTDSLKGILVGPSSNLNNRELILQTVDGGVTWHSRNRTTHNSSKYFMAIDTSSASSIYVAGNMPRIKSSMNGGNTWNNVAHNTFYGISDIAFPQKDTGIAIGEGVVLRSYNSGQSWTPDYSVGYGFRCLSFGGTYTGYIGTDNLMHKTIDRGNTWDTLLTPFYNIKEVLALNEDTLFVISKQAPNLLPNGIFRSTDGGSSWEEFRVLRDKKIIQFGFRGSKGYAVGENGLIYYTDNLGGTAHPVAAFDTTALIQCGYTDIVLTNRGSPSNTHIWKLGDSIVSNKFNDTIRIDLLSSKDTLRLISSNGTYTDTAVMELNMPIVEFVDVDAGDDIHICDNGIVQMSPTGYSNYTWWPADGLSDSTIKNPVVSISSSKTYYLTTFNDVCTGTDSITVILEAKAVLPGWENIPLPSISSYGDINNIQFTSPAVGYMMTGGDIFYRTNDSGNTWLASTPFSWNTFLSNLYFLNDSMGYVASNALYETRDSGKTWNRNYYIPGGPYRSVSFPTPDTGYAVSTRTIMRTIDGGFTWKKMHETPNNFHALKDVYCNSADECFFVGGYAFSYSFILISKDAGETYTNANLELPIFDIHKIKFYDKYHGVATGFGPYMMLTEDRGWNWKQVDIPVDFYHTISAAAYSTLDTLYAAVQNIIFKSPNGGACWDTLLNRNHGLGDIFFINPVRGFIGGSSTLHKIGGDTLFHFDVSNICTGEKLTTKNHSSHCQRYEWYVDTTLYASSYDTSFWFTNSGTYNISLYGYRGSDTLIQTRKIEVFPRPVKPMRPLGPADTACGTPYRTQFHVPSSTGKYHIWSLIPSEAGTILNMQNDTITVEWTKYYTGKTTLRVRMINEGGCEGPWSDSSHFEIFPSWVPPPQPTINDWPDPWPDTVCSNQPFTLLHVTGTPLSKFQWSIEDSHSATLSSDADSVLIFWDTTFTGNVQVYVRELDQYGCPSIPSDTVNIYVQQSSRIPVSPHGDSVVCGSPSPSIYRIPVKAENFSNVQWHIDPIGAATVSNYQDSMVASWDTSFSGTAKVWFSTSTSRCGAQQSDTIQVHVSGTIASPVILGADSICKNAPEPFPILPSGNNTSVRLAWDIFPSTAGTSNLTSDTLWLKITQNVDSVRIRAWAIDSFGCRSETSARLIKMLPEPVFPDLILGSDTLCSGKNAVFTPNKTSTGNSYAWKVLPKSAGTTSYSGDSLWFDAHPIFNGQVSITLYSMSMQGCPGDSVTKSILVKPLPASVSTISGPDTICEGSAVLYFIDTALSNLTYLWKVSPDTAAMVYHSGDSAALVSSFGYTGDVVLSVTPVSPFGCKGDSTFINIHVSQAPVNQVPDTPQGTLQVCVNENTTTSTQYITNAPPNSRLEWTLLPPAAGTIDKDSGLVSWNYYEGKAYIAVATILPCGRSGFSVPIEVQVAKAVKLGYLPLDTSINTNMPLELNANATGTLPINYTWFKNSVPLLGQTDSVLRLLQVDSTDGGSYQVNAKNICGTDTSHIIQVNIMTVSSVFNPTTEVMRIVPNPTTGIAYLKNKPYGPAIITIADFSGKVVRQVVAPPQAHEIPLQMQGLSDGIYFITLQSDRTILKGKIVLVNSLR
ncbi:MAG: YCF48-related protein [Bacteroidia bacterium]